MKKTSGSSITLTASIGFLVLLLVISSHLILSFKQADDEVTNCKCKSSPLIRNNCDIRHKIIIPNPKTLKGKLLITGIGRTGTSLLMAMFTDLGLKTGYGVDHLTNFTKTGNSGFENLRILAHGVTPNVDIFKSPFFACPKFSGLIESCSKAMNCQLLIPTRSPGLTSKSRANMAKQGSELGALLMETEACQQQFDSRILSDLIVRLVDLEAKFSFIAFPRFISSSEYAYKSLKFVFDKYNVSKIDFINTHRRLADVTKVHIDN